MRVLDKLGVVFLKKVLSVICALVIAALSFTAASAVDKAYLKGDADMNGRIECK